MTKIISTTPDLKAFGEKQLGVATPQDFIVKSTGTVYPSITGAKIEGDADFAVAAAVEGAYPHTVGALAVRVSAPSSLPPRAAFGFVKQGDYYYAVGGVTDIDVFNDCWRSLDGILWVRMSAACFDKGRSNFALFTLTGVLIAVGGFVEGVATDEIWTSADNGATWTKSGTAFPQKCAKMGYAQSADTLMIYGGIDHTLTYSATVSTSTNGTTWAQSGAAAPGVRADCTVVYCDGGYGGWYIIAGDNGTTPLLDDCWYWNGVGSPVFTDTGVAPFGGDPRAAVAGIGLTGQLLVNGGFTDISDAKGSSSGVTRYSANGGAGWVTVGTLAEHRAYHAMFYASLKLVVVGGLGEWPEVI